VRGSLTGPSSLALRTGNYSRLGFAAVWLRILTLAVPILQEKNICKRKTLLGMAIEMVVMIYNEKYKYVNRIINPVLTFTFCLITVLQFLYNFINIFLISSLITNFISENVLLF